MTDQASQPVNPIPDPASLQAEHKGILHQTLGEILQHNPHLQEKIIKSMHITPEQFQQMLGTAGNNQYMNMTIGDLFKSGFIQQAMKFSGQQPGQVVQITPEQAQQMMGQGVQVMQGDEGQPIQVVVQQQPQRQSFFQKLKGLFK